MTVKGYWVELYQERYRLGAGFLLTRRYVITALHCLRELSTPEDRVAVVIADGETVVGRVCQRVKEADMALIEIPDAHDASASIPSADIARPGDLWRGPCRPHLNEAQLSGQVDDGSAHYACEAGATIEALQLTADQHLGSYSGYSGGPVERATGGREPAVLGMLLEQAPDRQMADRAANVLFAVTVGEVIRRFDVFDVEHLMSVIRPRRASASHDGPAITRPLRSVAESEPLDLSSSVPSVEENIATADRLLRSLRQWTDDGLMDPSQLSQLQLRLAARLIDTALPGGPAAGVADV
ncbi:serine protease [Actinacidiphila glaucinigra]|uniref:S1 family peptidase n=1 Tax=Actinacidiphila glaucinigra TaxID=235986 RepID=UPI00325083E7